TTAFAKFSSWLNEGRHAGMTYLEQHSHCRENPKELLPGARSVLVFGFPYYQGDTLEEVLQTKSDPRVAQYARFVDYQRELKRRALLVAQRLETQSPQETFRVTVDSAPVLERDLAAHTSQGFIGKNTCYIHPEKGSFFLLGELLTSIDFSWDEPAKVDPNQHL